MIPSARRAPERGVPGMRLHAFCTLLCFHIKTVISAPWTSSTPSVRRADASILPGYLVLIERRQLLRSGLKLRDKIHCKQRREWHVEHKHADPMPNVLGTKTTPCSLWCSSREKIWKYAITPEAKTCTMVSLVGGGGDNQINRCFHHGWEKVENRGSGQ